MSGLVKSQISIAPSPLAKIPRELCQNMVAPPPLACSQIPQAMQASIIKVWRFYETGCGRTEKKCVLCYCTITLHYQDFTQLLQRRHLIFYQKVSRSNRKKKCVYVRNLHLSPQFFPLRILRHISVFKPCHLSR